MVTLFPTGENTIDEIPLPDALRMLEELGADVVGLNCSRGPETILPLMEDIKSKCKVHVALAYKFNNKITGCLINTGTARVSACRISHIR